MTQIDASTAADGPSQDGAPPDMARTDPRRKTQRRAYKIRGPETWALIRESYLAGAPARDLAARYDVTEWAIWRRAWKQGWTKDCRVEPTPPPALEPVTPEAVAAFEGQDADAGALSRMALRGVAEALRQNRLAEARNLSQIAASLDRIGGAGAGSAKGAGGYGLADVLRVLVDDGFANDLMFLAGESDDPEVARLRELMWDQREEGVRNIAKQRSEAFAMGRAEMRAELGLEVETGLRDVWVVHKGALMRHEHLEQARREWNLVPTSSEAGDDRERAR